MITAGVGSPFSDGMSDGLFERDDYAHLYPEGRDRAKYLDGVKIGREERAAGALEPVEALS